MLIHATFPRSTVNGPGQRAVVWLQGCTLNCESCWNPESHAFTNEDERKVEEIGTWVLSLSGIEGVTFSGGEPFQQADELFQLCACLKSKRPDFSIGLFSGYTLQELETGRWQFLSAEGRWMDGDPQLFTEIRGFLDFGILGRFNRRLACSDKPLCGSRNQSVVFFSERYSEHDLEPQAFEINIAESGEFATVTGFPPTRAAASAFGRYEAVPAPGPITVPAEKRSIAEATALGDDARTAEGSCYAVER